LRARLPRRDDRPIPEHPYRDAVLVYGVMAVLLIGVAWLTGGDVIRAVIAAGIFFTLATAWSWTRFRRRIKTAAAAKAAAARDSSVAERVNGSADGNGNGRRA